MASFQVLQNSTVLVCFDSRAAHNPPKWLSRRRYQRREDMFLPSREDGSDRSHGYVVFSKFFKEGDEV